MRCTHQGRQQRSVRSFSRRCGSFVGALAVGCTLQFAHAVPPERAPLPYDAAAIVDGKTLLIGNGEGLWRLELEGNGSATPTEIAFPVRDISVSEGRSVWVIGGWHRIHEPTDLYIAFSGDGGDTWTQIEERDTRYSNMRILASSQDSALILGDDGWLRTARPRRVDARGSGGAISIETLGSKTPRVWGLLAGARAGSVMCVLNSEAVWRSFDDGTTWTEFKFRFPIVVDCSLDECAVGGREEVFTLDHATSTLRKVLTADPDYEVRDVAIYGNTLVVLLGTGSTQKVISVDLVSGKKSGSEIVKKTEHGLLVGGPGHSDLLLLANDVYQRSQTGWKLIRRLRPVEPNTSSQPKTPSKQK